ncbi:MAG: glycosyltransferase [Rhodobacterales bacterium]|nr:glycosyltransferase [Rhodobacterales bacterium]
MTREFAATGGLGAVIIGRNEGERLVACLASLQGAVRPLVYVDSGSTDGSVAAAQAAGAVVVDLDTTVPFTAARARNAGFARMMEIGAPEFVQFVDGDCQMRSGWLVSARDFLAERTEVAVVCGRRREMHPEASVWNRLCDAEWDTPPGQAKYCGGDAMMRTLALEQVGGFNPDLIAGEEPELCVRLRAAGWKVWRLDREMTLHDAAMYRIGQWWKRTRRSGYAFAEGAAMHGAAPEFHWVAETRSTLFWGLALPLTGLLGLFFSPWAMLVLLAYPLQILRLRRRLGTERAVFLTLGKFPEALGVLQYYRNRVLQRRGGLIEYK